MAWGMKNIVISILGSSIMEGRIGVVDPMQRWYNLLLAQISRAHPETCFSIVNAAVGGESTREVMARLEQDVLPYNPDFCLFMAGRTTTTSSVPNVSLRMVSSAGCWEILPHACRKTQAVGVVLNPIVDEWHFATTHPAYAEHLAGLAAAWTPAFRMNAKRRGSFIKGRDGLSLISTRLCRMTRAGMSCLRMVFTLLPLDMNFLHGRCLNL